MSDYETARRWYVRLLGREPSFTPHATEAVWELGEHRSLYIDEDPGGAGRALHTILVDELDALTATIASRGIVPDETETYAYDVRKGSIGPTATRSGFGGVPSDAAA